MSKEEGGGGGGRGRGRGRGVGGGGGAGRRSTCRVERATGVVKDYLCISIFFSFFLAALGLTHARQALYCFSHSTGQCIHILCVLQK
jgi:hypothetical protein